SVRHSRGWRGRARRATHWPRPLAARDLRRGPRRVSSPPQGRRHAGALRGGAPHRARCSFRGGRSVHRLLDRRHRARRRSRPDQSDLWRGLRRPALRHRPVRKQTRRGRQSPRPSRVSGFSAEPPVSPLPPASGPYPGAFGQATARTKGLAPAGGQPDVLPEPPCALAAGPRRRYGRPMRVELAYGRGLLPVEIPEQACGEVSILEKAEVTPLADPDHALRTALEAPIEARPLRALARGRRDAVIIISDRTRPVPNALLLPPILDALREGGLPADRVTVQVATGLHRSCTPAELDEMLGAPLARSLRIVQHDARDRDSHQNLGTSRAGLPVLIDRFFLERDLRIVTGLIEPHLMAGYSGGRKAVCPGLAAVETIRVAHGAAMLEGRIGPGIVVGNPLHEALLEVVRKIGVDFLVNVALDRRRSVAGVFCGDLEAAHAEGMRFVEAESHVALDRAADLVIVSAGGDPLDATFYQAIKGIAA